MALHDLELYLIAFLEALVAFRLHRAVMDENVWSTILTDESKTLSVVEPFHGAFDSRHLHTFLSFLLGPNSYKPGDPNFQTTLGDCTRRFTSYARSEHGTA